MKGKAWHTEAVPPSVAETMGKLADQEPLGGFYLAGGTALALYYGHRTSRDLDFCRDSFDADGVLAQLQQLQALSVVSVGMQTLHLIIAGTKVSLLGYPYPLLFPLSEFQRLAVADPRDIGCMKLAAVGGRGSKRDFVDLYVLAREFGLSSLLDMFRSKYARIDYNILHILKSLTYFEDADREPMPDVRVGISWEEVKAFFIGTAPGLI